MALTWAALIEWQTIKVPVVAQVGPTAAFQRAHCHLIGPDRCLPGRGFARVLVSSGLLVQIAMTAGLVIDAPTGDASDRMAGKEA